MTKIVQGDYVILLLLLSFII